MKASKLVELIQSIIDENGDSEIIATVPYPDGVGFRQAKINNVTGWGGFIDIGLVKEEKD